MRLPYRHSRAAHRARCAPSGSIEVRGATRLGHRGYRYALTDVGRDRARQYLEHQPLRRPGAGAARGLRRADEGAGRRARLHRSRAAAPRASRTSSSATTCSSSWVRRSTPARRVFLYGPPGNGKTVIAEGLGRTHRRRHVHAARDRRATATSSRCSIRSTTNRSRPTTSPTAASSPRRAARSPLGAHPAARRDGRRRAARSTCST